MRKARLAFFGAFLLSACGSSVGSTGSDSAPDDHGCASGMVYCAGCNGGGFCAATCPGIACLANPDAGTGGSSSGSGSSSGGASSSGADASATDAAAIVDAGPPRGNSCPSGMPNYCFDCNGGGFCTQGGCLGISCPARDAGSPPASDGGTCGSASCGAGRLCVHPGCGGTAPPCDPRPDSGVCPAGTDPVSLCPGSQRPGCQSRPCTPAQPFCVDIPASCQTWPAIQCGCFASAFIQTACKSCGCSSASQRSTGERDLYCGCG
jgi:hypothetical protein